jgi:aflatoxin B1 aldehyde reductase
MPKAPITNIIFGTMTLGYRGYGARIHDAATADAMLGTVAEFGHDQLDTCSDYGDGSCEQMLGDLRAAERFGIATRIHPGNFHGHEPENLKRVFRESLARLKTGKVKILYLVARDSATPIESTLSAVQGLHEVRLFEEFGISNFSAWQVAEASEIAARHGWKRPSVYQGMYNAITRAVEPELFKCLGNYAIRFHAYNPLAGGAFSKGFGASGAVAAGSRFDFSHVQGKLYRDRYWNDVVPVPVVFRGQMPAFTPVSSFGGAPKMPRQGAAPSVGAIEFGLFFRAETGPLNRSRRSLLQIRPHIGGDDSANEHRGRRDLPSKFRGCAR